MIVKWRLNSWSAQISRVEVQRETATQVVLASDRREAKAGRYFDTWDEAHAALCERTSANLENARRGLQDAQGEHGNAVGLKRPE